MLAKFDQLDRHGCHDRKVAIGKGPSGLKDFIPATQIAGLHPADDRGCRRIVQVDGPSGDCESVIRDVRDDDSAAVLVVFRTECRFPASTPGILRDQDRAVPVVIGRGAFLSLLRTEVEAGDQSHASATLELCVEIMEMPDTAIFIGIVTTREGTPVQGELVVGTESHLGAEGGQGVARLALDTLPTVEQQGGDLPTMVRIAGQFRAGLEVGRVFSQQRAG